MRISIIMLASVGALSLGACNQAPDNKEAKAAQNVAATKKPKPAYCFFKEKETERWTAKADKSGNVVVAGRAYRSDSRYKAVLLPAAVDGSTATVSPTIMDNDTGYASPENWWPLTQTIPDSQAVTSVTVTCGARILAELSIPRRK